MTKEYCPFKDGSTRNGFLSNAYFKQIKHVFILTCALFFGIGIFSSAWANPEGGQVTAGQATISQPDANTVHVQQTSDKAVIDWRSFNIAPHETTKFQQPSSSSISLNRIDPSQGASSILGKLTANGQIWLINPAGVVFGASARIDVGGLIATTANITNQNFMSGNYHFIQSPDWNGAIINEGTITVADKGLVALVAPGVQNSGVIVANLGQVVLAASNEFVVDFYGDQLINFGLNSKITNAAVDKDGNKLKDGVKNTGTIIANGGKVMVAANMAENLVDNAINMQGFVLAKDAVQKSGEIVLMGESGHVVVAGTLDASGKQYAQKGGKIKIYGKKIMIADNARIDASGEQGGGEILIGGDYQGKNAIVPNAERTFVGNNVLINADAITLGQGGKIIVWADDITEFFGTISARGGSEDGDGGFVEVSGKNNLFFNGLVNTSAPKGSFGTLFLDPQDVTIQTATGSPDGDSFLPDVTAAEGGATTNYFITVGAILNNLLTSNVSIAASRDIFVNNTINDTSGAGKTLTLSANNNLTVAASTGITVPGGLTLISDADNSGAGTMTFNASSSVSSGNNALNITADDIVINATASLSSGTGLTTITGSANNAISLGSSASGIVLNNTELSRITAGDLTFVTTGGNILPTAATLTGIPGTVTLNSGDALTIGTGTTSVPNLIANATNTFTISGTLSATGTMSLKANTDGVGSELFTMGANGALSTSDTSANAISILVNSTTAGSGSAFLRNITTGAGGTLTVRTDGGNSATNSTGGSITTSSGTLAIGNLVMSTPSAITLIGTISATGTVALINNTRGSASSTFSMSAGSSITTTNSSANAVTITVNPIDVTTTGSATASIRDITVGNGGTITVTTAPTGNTAGGSIVMPSGTLIAKGGTINLISTQTGGNGKTIGTSTNKIVIGNGTANTGTVTLNLVSGSSGAFINSTDTGASPLSINSINSVGAANLTSAAAIQDTGAITATTLTTNSVGGTILDFGHTITGFNATNITSGNIQLVNTGTLSITGISQAGGGNVSITNTGNTTLGATATGGGSFTANITGTLGINNTLNAGVGNVTLISTGAMSDSAAGAITAVLLTAKTKNNAGAAIALDSGLHNATVIDFRARNDADNANAAGALTYSANGGFDVAAANTTSTVSLTGKGSLTQSGAMTGSTLTATTLNTAGGANSAITFTNSGNEFTNINLQTRNATNAANVNGTIQYQDATGINLSGLRTLGNATITAGGTITDNASLVIGGTLTTTSVGGLTLNNTNQINGFNATNNTSGGISFTANTVPLTITGISENSGGSVTISNTGDVIIDNNATFNSNGGAVTFTVSSGNLSIGSNATINAGNATITSNNITGAINVAGLTLTTSFANLNGFVDGSSGQEAIAKIILGNNITTGTHFFDGIDMASISPVPPTPLVPPTPSPTPTETTTETTTVNPSVVFPYFNNTYVEQVALFEFLADFSSKSTSDSVNDKKCVNLGSGINICSAIPGR